MKNPLLTFILGILIGTYSWTDTKEPRQLPEIHSKVPIDPEVHIIVIKDELDTTFVYKNPSQ